MYLKSIELSSFKSFGRKTSLSFSTPITSIVGPNGSGKSNIVESIRFVLGEQSMKSLRGKGGVDLIFKGSKAMSSANRASVSITFDNSKKIFSFSNSGLGISLDYDEIIISREVFADGGNTYSINGTEVRLKDIIDLLASVNIGSSGHHIISQGEADRVLNASSKDRRAMIEDALGLKIYQFRIRESERKLEKTFINMKEVSSLRREIAPHMSFLKKQVEKIEKAQALTEELRGFYKAYLSNESTYILYETKRLAHSQRIIDEKILSLDERIERIQSNKTNPVESEFAQSIKNADSEIYRLRKEKDDLARSLGRIEGILEGLERESKKSSVAVSEHVISESEWKSLVSNLESQIDEALSAEDMPRILEILYAMKSRLNRIFTKNEPIQTQNHALESEISEMQKTKKEIFESIEKINHEEKRIAVELENLRRKENDSQLALRDSERALYELLREKNEVTSDIHSLRFEHEKLLLIKTAFETELLEAGAIIGREVVAYSQANPENEIVDRTAQDELRRRIERIKIKLEDSGAGNGADIMKEYNDTLERDQFLAKELTDLEQSISSLKTLIQDLKDTLDREFKLGVEKINKQFQEFFSLMFGGGTAFLSIVMEHKKPKKDSEIEDDSLEADESAGDESLGFERGVDINVSLPQKKVRDLNMLSGGERSLTSIALLFAMSQVNPPPFLVLDETDAALDEANSRKYGNMLENLSKYSQLIVVTHNRETMSHAQVLYGITIGADGASKLLSIKLEDASSYAK